MTYQPEHWSGKEPWLVSKNFWVATAERAIKTLAQGFAAPVGLALAKGSGLIDLNWFDIGLTAGVMAGLSIAMSIISVGRGKKNSPSITESA